MYLYFYFIYFVEGHGISMRNQELTMHLFPLNTGYRLAVVLGLSKKQNGFR